MTTAQIGLAIVVGIVAVLAVRHRLLTRVVVHDFERGLLYRRGRRIRTLDAGVYWLVRAVSSVVTIDIRSRIAVVAGQEILTADSVPLRLSVTLRYRVAQPEIAVDVAVSFSETLHAETQLVLRDLVATVSAEEVVTQRQRLADGLQAALAPRASALGLALEEVGVRDVTFPAPLKQLFAQVVEARQAAQAALEKARGETAALRSLANAARMVEASPSLLQLRLLQQLDSSSGNTVLLGMPPATTPVPVRQVSAATEGPAEQPPSSEP